MPQATLDAFICTPKVAPVPVCEPAAPRATTPPPPPPTDAKRAPRLLAGGVSSVQKLVEAARGPDERAHVVLLSLSWRHNYSCGADRVIVANEPRGAAFDLRPPPKPKKGEPKEQPSTPSADELCGLVDAGEYVADLLLDDAHTRVVVMDGYPKGEVYARFVVSVAARCLKLRRRSQDVVLPRAAAPNDPICKEALARFKKSRSVEAMRIAAVDYYNDELADRFP
jgi:hypothetical protein